MVVWILVLSDANRGDLSQLTFALWITRDGCANIFLIAIEATTHADNVQYASP